MGATPLGLPVMLMGAVVVVATFLAACLPISGAEIRPIHQFLLAVGAGCLLFGWSIKRGAAIFGLLSFTLFVGGAARLWLTDPLWFPRMKFSGFDAVDVLMLALIVLQLAVASVIILRSGLSANMRRFTDGAGILRPLILLGVSCLFVVSVMGFLKPLNMTSYILHLIVEGGVLSISVLTILALGCVRAPVQTLPHLPIWAACVATIGISAVIAFTAFEAMPHVEDEVAYIFQAKTFAQGALSVPAPPEAARGALEYYLFQIDGDRWFSATAPGWPAVLALGALFGLTWLVNPLLAGACIFFGHGIAKRTVGAERANLIALLMLASPWLLAMAASYMTHTLSMVLMLFAWWVMTHPSEQDEVGRIPSLVGGLAIGWLFVTRPLEGLIVGVLTGLWLLFTQAGGFRKAIAFGIGCIATGLLFFAYNFAITGNPLDAPLASYLATYWEGGSNAFFFGPDIGPPGGWGALDTYRGHSPIEGVSNVVNNIASLQFDLFGWGIGSLAFVWALLLFPRLTGLDKTMLILVLVVVAVHFFYWFTGSYYIGPRYWFIAAFAFIVLTAAGIESWRARFPDSTNAIVLTLCIFSLSVFLPWRAVTKYHEYNRFENSIEVMSRGIFDQNALVFVKTNIDIGSSLHLNNPDLSRPQPLFLRDMGTDQNAKIIAAFPDRIPAYLEFEK